MALYDAQAFRRQSTFYNVRAFCTIFFHVALGAAIGRFIDVARAMIHHLNVGLEMKELIQTLLHMVPQTRLLPPLPTANPPHSAIPLCVIFGLAAGLGNCLEYCKEAQQILCLAEQEKHLALIAATGRKE
jgi:hypothetical protein